jgi:uncharacterized protein (DUF1778 family)
MAKTITVRVKDETYNKIKSAAESEHRTISNFIENATLAYVENSALITNEEMEFILEDSQLMENIKASFSDIKEGKYRIID